MCCKSNLDFMWMIDNLLKKAQCLQQPLHHRFKFGSLLSTATIFQALWLASFPAGPHSRPMRNQDSLLLLESAVRERRSEQHAVKKEQCSRPSKSSVSAEAFTSDGERSNFWECMGWGVLFYRFFPKLDFQVNFWRKVRMFFIFLSNWCLLIIMLINWLQGNFLQRSFAQRADKTSKILIRMKRNFMGTIKKRCIFRKGVWIR